MTAGMGAKVESLVDKVLELVGAARATSAAASRKVETSALRNRESCSGVCTLDALRS